jgi:preprotein translocase subunit YajC
MITAILISISIFLFLSIRASNKHLKEIKKYRDNIEKEMDLLEEKIKLLESDMKKRY